MLLDDFIEGGEHRGDGVVARPDVPLRIPTRQLLHQVPHRIFPCNTNVSKMCRIGFGGGERKVLVVKISVE